MVSGNDVIDYFTLESMALAKKLEKAKIVNCEDKRRLRIEAITVEGNKIYGPCADEREVRRSFTIIVNYVKWSNDIILEEEAKGVELWGN